MHRARLVFLALLAAAVASAAHAAAPTDAALERGPAGHLTVRWKSADPVDVYLAATPDAPPAKARLLARADRDGAYAFDDTDTARPYIILRDAADGAVARVAERLIVLDRGSNFRDLGGYPAWGGRHVRWGMIYRTAAMPMLTDADYAYVRHLGLASVVDLRSVEERQVAPDGVPARTGARYFAVDYPASAIFPRPGQSPAPSASQAHILELYRTWPTSLAAQYRRIFQDLLAHRGAVSFHCSAGQDRTGVATALVLAALGVPRDVIFADYQLSTADRVPANEIPPLTAGEYPGNMIADLYFKAQAAGVPRKAQPLYDSSGAPYLMATFTAIEAQWGSMDAYLDKVLGVGPREIARLRAIYLE